MSLRIGVFGSAFDPPTAGHKNVLEQASVICDAILLVPSIYHAFGKKSLDFSARLLLLNAFLEDLSNLACRVQVSDIEQTLFNMQKETPIYTYDVLNALQADFRQRNEDVELVFIRGPDNAMPDIWQRFYRFQDIENHWKLFTAKENVQVRSSKVREVLRSADNYTERQIALLEKQLTPLVLKCISKHLFYC